MPEAVFLPYRFAESALELQVTGVVVDGDPLPTETVVDSMHLAVLLSGRELWSRAELAVSVRDPNGELDGCLFDGESAPEACAVHVLMHGAESRLRRATLLEAADNAWVGAVSLDRAACRGPVRLDPVAVRSVDHLPAPQGGIASRRGERVGSGLEWTIYVDDRQVMPGSAIDSEWRDFATDELEALRTRTDTAWYLDLSNVDRPRLLLNEGVKGLKRVLQATARTGRAARVRDTLAHSILQPVLMAMASEALEAGREAAFDEMGNWQRELLLSLARHTDAQTEEAAVEGWLRAWKEGDRARVITALATGIQRHLGVRQTAEYLVRALEVPEDA